MKQIELSELQAIELDILRAIDSFCKVEGLTYFLAGGTLLGAIRHKGMIPWDNDVDISMPRRDYESLLRKWDSSSHQDYYTVRQFGNKYYLPFAKIEDRRTILKQDNILSNSDLGVFIDIFPIDAFGNDMDAAKQLLIGANKIATRLRSAGSPVQWKPLSNALKQIAWKMYYAFEGKDKAYRRVVEQLARTDWNKSSLIASTFGMRQEREIMSAEYFSSTVDVGFEGMMLPAPVGYDAYLKYMYGDYMQLPPEEKRVAPHEFDAFWR